MLGGGLQEGGVLSNSSLRRALHGILLQRKGLAPLLVFLGVSRGAGPGEADVRSHLAHELGISLAVILKAEAQTTREEAVRARELLRPRNVQRILLVTDSQHMTRARLLFERSGLKVLPAPVDEVSNRASQPGERLTLMRRTLVEFLARIYYRVAGYV